VRMLCACVLKGLSLSPHDEARYVATATVLEKVKTRSGPLETKNEINVAKLSGVDDRKCGWYQSLIMYGLR
jgi:hypothetical protein